MASTFETGSLRLGTHFRKLSPWCVASVNGRLETLDGRKHVRIDPSCIHLIADLEQVTIAANGDLDKSNPLLTHEAQHAGFRQRPPRP